MLKIDIYRALRFLPVGMGTGVLDTAIVVGGLYLLGRDGAVWAMLMGICVAYPINFFAHRHFTFGTGMTPVWRQAGTYALLKTPNATFRLLAALAIVAHQDWGVAVLVLVPVWSFFMKRWIFTGTPPWQKAV
ncbi:MAG: GtrA family protein [Candidatus Pacebacteria bacterium]|nr:GtrA family protein [Candidatus Paceibacterota bacterium]